MKPVEPTSLWGVVGAAVCATLAATGCAGPETAGGGSADQYWCWDVPVDPSALDGADTADTLDEPGKAALEGAEVPEIDPSEWVVLSESDERVALIRELDEPEDLGTGDVRTHKLLVVELTSAVNLDPSPQWVLAQNSSCQLVRDLGGEVATITLDPGNPPDPKSRELHLLVTERACNSGEDATGRVRLVDLEQGESTVGVAIVVDARGGAHDCPSNPPTPFVVELDEPLGDRTVADISVAPSRRLEKPSTP